MLLKSLLMEDGTIYSALYTMDDNDALVTQTAQASKVMILT